MASDLRSLSPSCCARASYVNGTELVVDGGLDCMWMDMLPRPGFNQTASASAGAAATQD